MDFIGFHTTNKHIVTSENHQLELPLYLDDLIEICNNKTAVFYDLDGSVASICKHLELTKEQCGRLLDKGKLYIAPFALTYYPQRFFSVDRIGGANHPYVNFANMNQVGYGEVHYTEDNSIEDSFKKAKEAKQTAEEVYKIFQKLEIANGSIVSPTSAFLKKHSFNWPTVDDLPIEVSKLAYEAVTGQWFEAYSLGHLGNDNNTCAYDYDLNASFLSIMADLLDIRRGQWLHLKELDSNTLNNAFYGVATGQLTTDAEFHPFAKQIKHSDEKDDKDNYTPTGTFPKTMTIQDLRFLDKHKLGTYKYNDGWFWLPKGKQYQPYRGVMMNLWQKRQGTTGREKLIIQRIYSSIYGRSLERHESTGFGELFNPIIGLTTLNTNALKVTDACLSNNIVPLAIMADGFISSQQCNLPISTKPGEWKLNAQGKCLIAGTAAVAFQNGKESAELAIDYNDLMQQIKDSPKSKEYKRTRWSPVTLALALERNFDELGEIKPIDRTLKIDGESKRHYGIKPKNGDDLINKNFESTAWDYSLLNI